MSDVDGKQDENGAGKQVKAAKAEPRAQVRYGVSGKHQLRRDFCKQIGKIDRLGRVVFASRFKRTMLVILHGMRGQRNDGDSGNRRVLLRCGMRSPSLTGRFISMSTTAGCCSRMVAVPFRPSSHDLMTGAL